MWYPNSTSLFNAVQISRSPEQNRLQVLGVIQLWRCGEQRHTRFTAFNFPSIWIECCFPHTGFWYLNWIDVCTPISPKLGSGMILHSVKVREENSGAQIGSFYTKGTTVGASSSRSSTSNEHCNLREVSPEFGRQETFLFKLARCNEYIPWLQARECCWDSRSIMSRS